MQRGLVRRSRKSGAEDVVSSWWLKFWMLTVNHSRVSLLIFCFLAEDEGSSRGFEVMEWARGSVLDM